MEDKVVSWERLKAIYILVEHFSENNTTPYSAEDRLLFYLFGEGDNAINRVAKILHLSSETIKRYMREGFTGVGENEEGKQKTIGVKLGYKSICKDFPDEIRAICVLLNNKYTWKEIGWIFQSSSEAIRKKYKRYSNKFTNNHS